MKFKLSILSIISIFTYAFSTSFAFAQNTTLGNVISETQSIIALVVPVIFGIAMIVFLWAGIELILKGGDKEGREKAKKKVFYGVITLFIMFSVWGFVRFLQETFNVDSSVTPIYPQLK